MLSPDNVPLMHLVVALVIILAGLVLSLRLLFWSKGKHKADYNYRRHYQDQADFDHHTNVRNQLNQQLNDHLASVQNPTNPATNPNVATNANMDNTVLEQIDLAQIEANPNHQANPSITCAYGSSFVDHEAVANTDASKISSKLNVEQDLALAYAEINPADPSNQLYTIDTQNYGLDEQASNLYFDQERYQSYMDAKQSTDL